MEIFTLIIYMFATIIVMVKAIILTSESFNVSYDERTQLYGIADFFTIGMDTIPQQYRSKAIHTMLTLILFGILTMPLMANISAIVLLLVMLVHSGLGLYHMFHIFINAE